MESFRKVRPCAVKEFSSVAMEETSASSINVTFNNSQWVSKVHVDNQLSFGEPSEFKEKSSASQLASAEHCDVTVSSIPFAFFGFSSEWATLEDHNVKTLKNF